MLRNKFKSLLLELVGEAIDVGIDRAASALASAREAKSSPSMDPIAEPTPRKMPEGTRLSLDRCECGGPLFYAPYQMRDARKAYRYECPDCGEMRIISPKAAAQKRGSPVTPTKLMISVVRFARDEPQEARMFLVTAVVTAPKDWRVSVWWGQGAGEVEFSLATGRQITRHVSPWRLSHDAAKALLNACSAELEVPASCTGSGWWGNARID